MLCNSFSLDSSTLDGMRKHVFQYDVEICGYLDSNETDEHISLKIKRNSLVKGYTETYILEDGTNKTREACKSNTLFSTPYEYHSHPASISKAYPSYEDINKIYKDDYKKVSVIATKWGLFVIKKPIDFSNDNNNSYPKEPLTNILNTYFYTINRGRHELPLPDKYLRRIHDGCEKLSEEIGLVIKFCYWKDLGFN